MATKNEKLKCPRCGSSEHIGSMKFEGNEYLICRANEGRCKYWDTKSTPANPAAGGFGQHLKKEPVT